MLARIAPLLAALALAACSSTHPGPEVATQSGRVDRAVVAPMNLALRMPVELAGMETPVWDALLGHFHARDRMVQRIDPVDARALWSSVVTEMGAARSLEGASAEFARRLAEHSEYDLLVMPALVMRRAELRGSYAYWDGVRRKVTVKGAWDAMLDEIGPVGDGASVFGLSGGLAGASLYVSVLTADGRPVYRGLGGLDLLQEADHARDAKRGEWSVVLRQDPFSSPQHLTEGVQLALERKLPRTARAW